MHLRVKGLLLCVICFGFQTDVRAQLTVDASLHTDWLEQTDVYGVGGSVHFVFSEYAFELVPSGAHFFAEDDTTASWSVAMDARLNLLLLGPLRPYAGVGVDRLRHRDQSDWLLSLAGGVYLRVRGDRIFPFVEAAHRPGDSLNPWRFQAGLRFIMREP